MNVPKFITPILKLVEFCNYNCYFCRYANHPQISNVMSVSDVKKVLKEVAQYNKKNGINHVKVIFHGGEPLLWGINKFEEVLNFQSTLENEYTMKFINSIQSNGFLLNEQWIDILKRYNFSVGISLDGPDNLNGHFGKLGNLQSIKQVLQNINLLRNANISFGVLSVITNKHYGYAKEFYDFWVNNNISDVGLCFCFNPEDNETVNCELLSIFLKELFDLYFYGDAKINIREFNNAIQRITTRKSSCCTYACRKNCGNFLTIDSCERVMFCDDYTLDKTLVLGNLKVTSLNEIIYGKRYQLYYQKSHEIIKKCIKCPVFEICGSGCSRNDIGKSNYFCPTYKIIYSHISYCVDKMIMDGHVVD